jgi:hypothetical protein
MCLLIALLLGIAGLFGFAGISSEFASPPAGAIEVTAEAVQIPTQAISCESVSEEEDIRNMLTLVGDTFESTAWTQEISNDASRTTGMWRASASGAVVYVEVLHYDCGISREQIKQNYDAAGFANIFSNYSSHSMTAQCAADGVRLFEFDAVFDGGDYHVLYWVKQPSPTRVAGIMMTFPASDQAQLAEYAGRLFPELPTCEAAAG